MGQGGGGGKKEREGKGEIEEGKNGGRENSSIKFGFAVKLGIQLIVSGLISFTDSTLNITTSAR
jgi:hypothetical protein